MGYFRPSQYTIENALRERFKAQEELLAQGDDEANTTDEDFMNALEIGMPQIGRAHV